MSRKGSLSISRKDDRRKARFSKTIGKDGRKKYVSGYVFSFPLAKEKTYLCIQQTEKPIVSDSRSQLLSAIMYEWLLSISHSIKKTTHQKYESAIKNHISSDTIGNMQVKNISPANYSCFVGKLLNHKGLSPKSVNDILVVLGAGLSYAEETYGIKKPKLPRVKEIRKEMRVLSVDEQKKLEQYLYKNKCLYSLGILLTLYTGIRIGELCALQWEDVYEDYLLINKTLNRIHDKGKTIIEITPPKTSKSIRKIPLPQFIKPYIEQFRDEGSLLKNNKGKPVEPRLMQMKFERIVLDCGLAKTNFHALRHTFATRCIETGFDVKTLSEI